MELEMVAGGIPGVNQQLAGCADGSNAASDGFFGEAVSTVWEIVKYSIFG